MSSTDNLIDAWLANDLSTPGRRQADAIRDLNEALGTRYTASRIGQFRRGERVPSARAMGYMARAAVSWVLLQEGIKTTRLSDETLDRIADRLSVPCRKEVLD